MAQACVSGFITSRDPGSFPYMIWPYFILIAMYGACVGSFLNVVIYRMPRDQSLWHPGSHCPRCAHKLAWYDNLPILGWLLLRGRCRYCAWPINLQYPLVETVTLALFGLLPAIYYLTGFRPTFHALGMVDTWIILTAHLMLLAGLLATTIIDARYYIIPLSITWFITLVALILLPLAAWYKPQVFLIPQALPLTLQHEAPIVPATGKHFWNAQIGAVIGLGLANVLLIVGYLPHSFGQFFTQNPSAAPTEPSTPEPSPAPTPMASEPTNPPPPRWRLAWALIASIMLIPCALGYFFQGWGMLVAMGLLWLAAMVIALLETSSDPAELHGTPDIWLAHPQPRREILKEVLFLLLPVGGAMLGHYLLPRGWMQDWQPQTPAPFVLGGVVMGYLLGGALIWGTRILGTLVFGKEAMGLGDVHLLACIGAMLGPIDAVIVFFLAPVLGLLCILVSVGVGRLVKGEVRAIPYGPYLALATVVLMVIRDQLGFLGL